MYYYAPPLTPFLIIGELNIAVIERLWGPITEKIGGLAPRRERVGVEEKFSHSSLKIPSSDFPKSLQLTVTIMFLQLKL